MDWVLEHAKRTIKISVLKKLIKEYLRYRQPHLWARLKREIADIATSIILAWVGHEKIRGIYYTDLVGGENAATSPFYGRDVDIIVWVEKDTNIDIERLEEVIDAALSKLFERYLGVNYHELTGPCILELHVVRDPRREPYGNLIFSYFTPAIPIWVRKRNAGDVEKFRET